MRRQRLPHRPERAPVWFGFGVNDRGRSGDLPARTAPGASQTVACAGSVEASGTLVVGLDEVDSSR
jgi:hypothetical protein